MSGTNNFLPFATGVSALVQSQADFAAASTTTNGFQNGIAEPDELNKVWRQSSFMAAALAQFVANYGLNALDDGDLTEMVGNLNSVLLPQKTTVASATSPDIWTLTGSGSGDLISYTGVATATSFADAPANGLYKMLLCAGASKFTAGANMLIQGYASGSTYTAAAGDIVLVQAVTMTQFRMVIFKADGTPTVPQVVRSYIAGLTLSTVGGSANMSIAAGQAADSTNAVMMTLGSAVTKNTGSWAVGTGQGGLDAGTIANSTWYYFFEIMRPDTGVVDVVFSLGASGPTLPTNYTYYRYIGAGRIDGSGHWLAFTQDGDYFRWSASILDINTTNPGTSAVTATLTLPSTTSGYALLNVLFQTSALDTILYVSDISAADETPSETAAPLGNLRANNGITNNNSAAFMQIRTNVNTIRYRASASDGSTIVKIATLGWIDRRGRDA